MLGGRRLSRHGRGGVFASTSAQKDLRMATLLTGSLYDYPAYYDLVFGSDWKAEFAFLEACFDRHAARKVKHIFEPACGTGRLLVRLAQAGYRVSGLDLNPKAVQYCNDRLRRKGVRASVFVGDMTDFRLPRPADAAFNMINSFRHLSSEEAAEAHLHCMAEALKPGGLYALGLHLTPSKGRPMDEESWTARRGHLQVNTRLKTIRRRPAKREEWFTMTCDIYTPTEHRRLQEEIMFRSYTAEQFQELLDRVGRFDVLATYDFHYRIDRPIEIRPHTEDVVFILRRIA